MRIKWILGFLFSEFPGFVSHSVWAHLSPAEVSVLIFPSIDSCWINEIKACGGSFFPSLEKLDWSENGLGGDGNFCWSPNYCAWLISVSHHQQNSHRQSDLRQSNTEIAFFCLTLQLSPWGFFSNFSEALPIFSGNSGLGARPGTGVCRRCWALQAFPASQHCPSPHQ